MMEAGKVSDAVNQIWFLNYNCKLVYHFLFCRGKRLLLWCLDALLLVCEVAHCAAVLMIFSSSVTLAPLALPLHVSFVHCVTLD